MLYFCSCATATEFLGGYMVDADNANGAVQKAIRLGFHPGGEVLVLPIGDILTDDEKVASKPWLDRLLSKTELEDHSRALGKDPNLEDRNWGSLSEEERQMLMQVATKMPENMN